MSGDEEWRESGEKDERKKESERKREKKKESPSLGLRETKRDGKRQRGGERQRDKVGKLVPRKTEKEIA